MNAKQAELLVRAREALDAARRDAQAAATRFATSHAYYACFYAARAALLERNLSFSSHSAVIAAFGKEFAKAGILPRNLHAVLREQFDDRSASDYGSGQKPTAGNTEKAIAAAEEFVAAVEKFLKTGSK